MKGKTVIVYYTWIGSTKVVAEEIGKLTGFDVQEIKENKKRKLGSIMGPAFGAFIGMKSSIKHMDFELSGYDNILLGVQVWAGKTTPAINKYLKKASFKDKKVWFFTTQSDERPPDRFIDSIRERIEKKGGKLMDWFSFKTFWDPKTNIPVSRDDIADDIKDWIETVINKLEDE